MTLSFNLEIYTHKIRYIFNKTVNLTQILLNSNLYNSIVQVGIFDGEILYKLQLVQPIFFELQLVQTACTNCNLYRPFVQVATCVQNLNLYSLHIKILVYLLNVTIQRKITLIINRLI